MNWTDKGILNAKDSPSRLEATKKYVEDLGGKIVYFLYTIGEYDAIAIVETPSDEVFMKFILSFGGQGNVRRTTLKAWTDNEALRIFSQL
jgi:uncharacterized protein with GYD domain